jgi:hypothetical protein
VRAAEQVLQQHAEAVDVRGRRDAPAAHLFGRGVVGREGAQVGLRVLFGVLGVEQLGDAEVEELRRPVGGDEDVRRLDVAVDDEVTVRVRDAAADGEEQFEPRRGREVARGAVVVDAHALDVLHGEERLAVGRDAAV